MKRALIMLPQNFEPETFKQESHFSPDQNIERQISS